MTTLFQWVANRLPSASAFALAALFACLVFAVQKIGYNLYFHPLARYPGPPLAAISKLWRAYVECFQKKSTCHELRRLHATYGVYLPANNG